MPASALIDPLTGKPFPEVAPEKAPDAPPASAGTAAPVAPSPAAAAPVASGCSGGEPTAPTDDRPIRLPEWLSPEDREMHQVVAATFRSMLQAGLVKLPTPVSPPT
jgi:hypothetical protein